MSSFNNNRSSPTKSRANPAVRVAPPVTNTLTPPRPLQTSSVRSGWATSMEANVIKSLGGDAVADGEAPVPNAWGTVEKVEDTKDTSPIKQQEPEPADPPVRKRWADEESSSEDESEDETPPGQEPPADHEDDAATVIRGNRGNAAPQDDYYRHNNSYNSHDGYGPPRGGRQNYSPPRDGGGYYDSRFAGEQHRYGHERGSHDFRARHHQEPRGGDYYRRDDRHFSHQPYDNHRYPHGGNSRYESRGYGHHEQHGGGYNAHHEQHGGGYHAQDRGGHFDRHYSKRQYHDEGSRRFNDNRDNDSQHRRDYYGHHEEQQRHYSSDSRFHPARNNDYHDRPRSDWRHTDDAPGSPEPSSPPKKAFTPTILKKKAFEKKEDGIDRIDEEEESQHEELGEGDEHASEEAGTDSEEDDSEEESDYSDDDNSKDASDDESEEDESNVHATPVFTRQQQAEVILDEKEKERRQQELAQEQQRSFLQHLAASRASRSKDSPEFERKRILTEQLPTIPAEDEVVRDERLKHQREREPRTKGVLFRRLPGGKLIRVDRYGELLQYDHHHHHDDHSGVHEDDSHSAATEETGEEVAHEFVPAPVPEVSAWSLGPPVKVAPLSATIEEEAVARIEHHDHISAPDTSGDGHGEHAAGFDRKGQYDKKKRHERPGYEKKPYQQGKEQSTEQGDGAGGRPNKSKPKKPKYTKKEKALYQKQRALERAQRAGDDAMKAGTKPFKYKKKGGKYQGHPSKPKKAIEKNDSKESCP